MKNSEVAEAEKEEVGIYNLNLQQKKIIRQSLLVLKGSFQAQLEETEKQHRQELIGDGRPIAGCNHPADMVLSTSAAGIREGNLKKCIGKIDDALKRLKENTYGICVVCGGGIPDKRLAACLFADKCVKCKEELNNGLNNRRRH